MRFYADFGINPVRGVMAGTLKNRLGLAGTSQKVEGRGRVYKIGRSA
jgi:Protein of unknown function (DUF3489)